MRAHWESGARSYENQHKSLIEAFGDDHNGVVNVPELMSARRHTAEEHEVGTLASLMSYLDCITATVAVKKIF